MSDRRSIDREKVIARVEVIAADGAVALVASVFNVSETGMSIGTPENYRFPANFRVRLMGSGEVFPASVAWQRSGLAGLTFIGHEGAAPPKVE